MQELKVFSALYDDYSPALYGEIRQNLYDNQVCEEVMVKSFCEIWKSMDQFDASTERLFTWCSKIVRKEIRKRKTELLLKEIFTCQRTVIRKPAVA